MLLHILCQVHARQKHSVNMQSILFSAVSMLFVVFLLCEKAPKFYFISCFTIIRPNLNHHINTIFHLLRFASFLCRCYIFYDDFYV